jgi:hypothetical protein
MATSSSLAGLADLTEQFDSPEWNSSKALLVLYTHKNDRTAVPAICNAMRKLADSDLMHTLMQFCHLLVVFEIPELEELLLER